MLSRLMLASLLALSLAAPAMAQEAPKPDDTITFDLTNEDWVTTKTAHVTLDVEASVGATNAGTMRSDMIKAVNDTSKADWRLISFNRSQDQSGMERWSVNFDARLPENALGGLTDTAKKASKPGMQINVGSVDFTPTLDETEATRSGLRTRLLKQASDQLASLNATLPGRAYRIAQISFDAAEEGTPPRMPMPMMHRNMLMATAAVASPPSPDSSLEQSQKITLTAHVTFAALPPTTASAH